VDGARSADDNQSVISALENSGASGTGGKNALSGLGSELDLLLEASRRKQRANIADASVLSALRVAQKKNKDLRITEIFTWTLHDNSAQDDQKATFHFLLNHFKAFVKLSNFEHEDLRTLTTKGLEAGETILEPSRPSRFHGIRLIGSKLPVRGDCPMVVPLAARESRKQINRAPF